MAAKAPDKKAAKLGKLRKLIDDMRADGVQGLYFGDEITDAFDDRLPSDIVGLNTITRGGFVFNGINELVGPPSTFKTTVALGACKMAQQRFGAGTNILWLSTEGVLDMNWARHNGVKIPYSKDEVKKLQALGMGQKEIADAVKDQASRGLFIFLQGSDGIEEDIDRATAMVETGELNVFVIDSVGAFSATGERESAIGDSQVAINARLIRKFSVRLLDLCKKLTNEGAKTAIIVVNQVRSVIGGMPGRGPKTQETGGWGLKHNKHLSLEFRVSGFLRDKKKSLWGKDVTVKVEKSKVCIPHRTCTVQYVLTPDNPLGLPIGPNVYAEVAGMAADCGVFQYKGTKWWYDDELIEIVDMETGEVSSAKKDQLMYYLYQNPDKLDKVRSRVINYHTSLEITGKSANALPQVEAKEDLSENYVVAEEEDAEGVEED